MNKRDFLKLLLPMPFALPAIVSACGKPKITCTVRLTSNPALIALTLLRECGVDVNEASFYKVALNCGELEDSRCYNLSDVTVMDEVRRLGNLGGFKLILNGYEFICMLKNAADELSELLKQHNLNVDENSLLAVNDYLDGYIDELQTIQISHPALEKDIFIAKRYTVCVTDREK